MKRARPHAEPLALVAELGFRACAVTSCFGSTSCSRAWTRAARRIHVGSRRARRSNCTTRSPRCSSTVGRSILIDLTRQTLRAQLWTACLGHALVAPHAQAPLRPDQPLHVALDTLDLLEDVDQLALHKPNQATAIREAVGTIRACVGALSGGQWAQEEFSFDHIDDSDEAGSAARPQSAGGRGSVWRTWIAG